MWLTLQFLGLWKGSTSWQKGWQRKLLTSWQWGGKEKEEEQESQYPLQGHAPLT
jgi:hypothetical protein